MKWLTMSLVTLIGMTFCVSAEGSCIVSGDISRDAAVAASSTLVTPGWFDSSSFFLIDTYLEGDFDSFRPGFSLIFR